MANQGTIIGRTSFVRGRITGPGDLDIAGRVEGDVEVEGDITVDTHGLVAANLTGRRLVVRGAVKGDLTASDGVALEDGAKVVGDVRAPRISIATGALLRGHVQTDGTAAPRARAAAPAASAARPQARPAAAPARAAAAPQRSAAPAVVAKVEKKAEKPAASAARVAPKGPPAPVVPVLKKGAKGSLAKKRAG